VRIHSLLRSLILAAVTVALAYSVWFAFLAGYAMFVTHLWSHFTRDIASAVVVGSASWWVMKKIA
jgi:hypothetical protein